MPSYHDLHITTDDIPRTSIFNLPFGLEVSCTRVAGWQLWNMWGGHANAKLLAGEYDSKGLRLDIDGRVIVDSLNQTGVDTT